MRKEQFLDLLSKAKERIEATPYHNIISGEHFEDYAYSIIEQIASERGISGVRQTGKQSFPDIVVEHFGIEVKFSNSNKWESTGNSIFESTHQSEVTKDIYIFFGKKEPSGRIQVKFDAYENCLIDVKVTHSPRFYIHMDQNKNKSVFTAMEKTYNEYKTLNNNEKTKLVKKYLASKLGHGEKVWWMDEVTAPVVKDYRTFDRSKKDVISAELFALFPELLTDSTDKYVGASIYLLTKHQLINSSFRDEYSAGGKVNVKYHGTAAQVPKIFANLYKRADLIRRFMENADVDLLLEHWLEYRIARESEIIEDRIEAWKKIIDMGSQNLPHGLKPSLFFEKQVRID